MTGQPTRPQPSPPSRIRAARSLCVRTRGRNRRIIRDLGILRRRVVVRRFPVFSPRSRRLTCLDTHEDLQNYYKSFNVVFSITFLCPSPPTVRARVIHLPTNLYRILPRRLRAVLFSRRNTRIIFVDDIVLCVFTNVLSYYNDVIIAL